MRTFTHAQRPELLGAYESIESGSFPEFMLHDRVWNEHWPLILEAFGEFQLYLMDSNQLAGVVNTVPITWDDTIEDLPASEHDVLARCLRDSLGERPITTLAAIQVAISDAYAGTGAAQFALQEAQRLCVQHKLSHLIAPVRPTMKHLYPTISFATYVDWLRDDGLPFDPWIRAQVRGGARRLGICREPMVFEGTVAEWEDWTGLTMPSSGDYVIEGALELLSVDIEKDRGRLEEFNVWYCYDVSSFGSAE